MGNSVRVPPPRPFEGVRCATREQYVCPMCGEDAGYKRGWWHKDCATVWNLATGSRWQLTELWANAGTKCWECRVGHGVDVDHIKPLWSLTRAERKELKWWLPFNLQLLCRKCHASKTKREAAERAAIRRAA